MAPNPASYSYPGRRLKGADTIRVLHLQPYLPADSDQRLKCELRAVHLSSNPTYSAVSYTWGKPDLIEDLWVGDALIRITRNLHELLAKFRRADKELVLWIDAVCINQSDKKEKATQIPLMSKIYSSANDVLIWLGEGSPESDAAMDYLKRVGRKFVDRGGEIKEPRYEPESQELWRDVQTDPALERSHIIWDRPWFSRRWIIQELAFARKATIYCGSKSLDWDELNSAYTAIAMSAGDGSFLSGYLEEHEQMFKLGSLEMRRMSTLQKIRDDMKFRNDTGSSRGIISCVADAWEFDCKEEKDRLFALLGIINQGRQRQLAIDYNLSITKIYAKFANYCIKNGDPMDKLAILSYAGMSNRAQLPTQYQLPTWIPDWRASFDGPGHKLNGFCAGNAMAPHVELKKKSKELLVRGIPIDRVQHVLGSISSFASPNDPSCSIQRPNHQATWYRNIEDTFANLFGPYRFQMPQGVVGHPYIMGGTAWEALFRTLVLDTHDLIYYANHDVPSLGEVRAGPEFPFWEEGTGFRRRMLASLEQPDLDAVNNDIIVIPYEMLEYYARASINCENRSFYITERGFLGLGPEEMEVGDIISLICGACTPHVLRPEEKDLSMLWDPKKKPMWRRLCRPCWRVSSLSHCL
ncbi:heterokaryon incompatibility protein-domain-containing protein [Cadophora sp. MPI-SDFR-AT-0126]|nr:heterokaryon incompatibility protein-domain-containing protein [Leotiomycetes sp. MPI-SDFR-AT-0126]